MPNTLIATPTILASVVTFSGITPANTSPISATAATQAPHRILNPRARSAALVGWGSLPASPRYFSVSLYCTMPRPIARPAQKKPPRQFQASPMVPATSGATSAPRLMPM